MIGLQALARKPGENGEEMLVFICFHGKMLVFIWKKCENMVFAWVLASLNGVFMFLFQKKTTRETKVKASWILGRFNNN